MIFAIDFDGTIVNDAHAYGDLDTPLQFKLGAKEAIYKLKRAGHTLLLWSARANRALLYDADLDPLVRSGSLVRRPLPQPMRLMVMELSHARYRQMCDFVQTQLPGVFDAIDDGFQGKPVADVFIDDRAIKLGEGFKAFSWDLIAQLYGDADPARQFQFE